MYNYLKFLLNNNIGSRNMYPPLNRQKAYKLKGSFPVSEKVGRNGLWLPSSSQLTDEDIDFVCEKVNEFYLG